MPDRADECLLALLGRLRISGYRFVPPTPATHRRVTSRPSRTVARDLRDIFGWSLPFPQGALPSELHDLLQGGGMIEKCGDLFKSGIRVASIGDRLFLHSRFPTDDRNSVFLGPDSYRFVRFLRSELRDRRPVRQLVDIGAGAGVGAIEASDFVGGARLLLTDINPLALRFARINARHAGVKIETAETPGVEALPGSIDLVVMNPPFIIDPAGRAYRDGGGMHGAALSLAWALSAADRLAPGGRLLLYTGSAIVGGEDRLQHALRARLADHGFTLRYEELDPDIFGEQLDQPGYGDVERIVAVGAIIGRGD